MPKIEQLLKGFAHFRENYFEKDTALFQQLATQGQKLLGAGRAADGPQAAANATG